MGIKLTACTIALMFMAAILVATAAYSYRLGYIKGITETAEMLLPAERKEIK